MSKLSALPRRAWPAAIPAAGGLAALLAPGGLAGLLALAVAEPVAAQTTDRVVDLGGLFEGAEEATFVLLDLETGRAVRHDPVRAAERFLPASTFKIPNTLIALETGAVDGPGHAIAWDSLAVPRERFFPSSWARDQTLETAFRNSVYWYYQALARRIGPETYRKWLARFDYGNRNLGGGIDAFWLEGEMRISADEQVEFLRRLWTGELGVTERSTRIVKDLMLLDEGPGHRLLGKTGTAEVTPTRELGWIVGVVEMPDGDFAYALNMEGERVWETWPPGRRKELVVEILEELELLRFAAREKRLVSPSSRVDGDPSTAAPGVLFDRKADPPSVPLSRGAPCGSSACSRHFSPPSQSWRPAILPPGASTVPGWSRASDPR